MQGRGSCAGGSPVRQNASTVTREAARAGAANPDSARRHWQVILTGNKPGSGAIDERSGAGPGHGAAGRTSALFDARDDGIVRAAAL